MDRALQHLTRLSSFERARRPRPSKSTDSLSTVRSGSIDASLPHIDALPSTPDGLEGRLNHLASQLQIMALRVDALNEMIDMENIVLARLSREQKEAGKKFAEEGEGGDVRKNGGGEGSVVFGGFKNGSGSGREEGETEEEAPPLVTNEMRNKQMLVAEMRRLRKGMEKSVVWQRDEYWRVERAMGRRGVGSRKGEEGEGGGVKGRHR